MNVNESNSRSRRTRIASIAAAALLLIGVVAWLVGGNRPPGPGESPERVRQFVASDRFNELPSAEKQKYLENIGRIVEPDAEQQKAMMNLAMARRQQMLDDYFALPEGKARKDYLDQRIDEMEQLRKRLESPTTQPGGANFVIKRGGPGAGAQKDMAEGVPAEYQGKMAQYMKDLKQRRAERGLPADGPGGGGMMIRIGNAA